MPFRDWCHGLLARRRLAPPRRCRPEVEVLEDRLVPTLGAQFTINGDLENSAWVQVASSASGLKVSVYSRTIMGNEAIFAQRYDANGVALGEIPVSSANDNTNPDVAMDALGNFVVVWTNSSPSSDPGIRYSTFDDQGAVIVNNSVLADTVIADERVARVAMNAAGTWVVAIESAALLGFDIFAQRYDLQGNQLGTDIAVAARPLTFESLRGIDCNAAGRFAIAYELSTSAEDTLFLKRYKANGKLLGTHKIAVSGALGAGADVAMDNAGNAVVVYDQGVNGTSNIYSRRVSANGTLGPRQNIAIDPVVHENEPRVAMDRVSGRYVIFFYEAGIPTIEEHAKNGALLATLNVSNGDASPELVSALSFDAGVYFVAYLEEISPTNKDVRGRFGSL